MIRIIGIITCLFLFSSVNIVCAGSGGRPSRLKPPVWIETGNLDYLRAVKSGDEADLMLKYHVIADVDKVTIDYDSDATLDIVSEKNITKENAKAGDIIDSKVKVKLNGPVGTLKAHYNTYFSYGHIGDTMYISVGSGADK
jgi:hypothetical protein